MIKSFFENGTYVATFEALPSVNYPEGYKEAGSAFIADILQDRSDLNSSIGKQIDFVLKRNDVDDLLLGENFLDNGINVSICDPNGSTKTGTYSINKNKLVSCKKGFSYTLGGYFITKKVIVKKCNNYFSTWFFKTTEGSWQKYGSGSYKKI